MTHPPTNRILGIAHRRSSRVRAVALPLVVLLGGSLIHATATLGGAFPAGNGKIAYSSYQAGNNDIYTRNADGTGETRLTTDTNIDTQPAVSADGSKIVYATKQGGGAYEVYSMSADGSGKTNLSNDSDTDFEPTWSPDGTKVAFTSDRSGSLDVWVMDADGSDPVNLTSGVGAEDQEPTWSPDGAKIAFASKRSGNFDVWVMNADGSNPTNLTTAAGEDQWPTWSPDGAKIAFGSKRSGNFDIWVMNADGTIPLNLTSATPAEDQEPSWSPDGTKIAFASKRSGNFDIWVMNADGSSPENQTSANSQEDYTPDWGALPAPPSFSGTSPQSPANDNDPEILGSAQAGTTVTLYTDAACTSPVAAAGSVAEFATSGLTVSVADDSTTTFYATATNVGGTSACSLDSISFTEDSTPAESTITAGPSGITGGSSPTFSFGSSEPGSTFECRVDGGAWVACSSPHSVGPLADGSHTFEVRAVDAAGNTDQTPDSVTITVDTVAPQTSITAGPSGATGESSPTFSFGSAEPGSTFECRLDGGAWVACSSPHGVGPLADGSHTFEVRAVDAAGNADQTPDSVTITVDTAGPGSQPGGSQPGGSQPSGQSPQLRRGSGAQDLSTIPGNLAAAGQCQRLTSKVRSRRVRVRGLGVVDVRIRANAFVTPAEPVLVTVRGPRGLRSARYVLDGRRMRGAARAPFKLALRPESLSKSSRHVLTVRLTPRRGKARKVKLRLSTTPCRTVFVASHRRTGSGSQLKLRVDSVRALRQITFKAPQRWLPKRTANQPVGKLVVRTEGGGRKSYRLAFRGKRGRSLLSAPGTPRVLMGRGKVTINGLPAGTGMIGLTLNARSAGQRAAPRGGRPMKLRARVVGAEGVDVLSTKIRTPRRR